MEFDYLKDIDDESLFHRLEDLLAKLEQIQEKDALLTKATCARELINANDLVKELKTELDGYEKIKDQARQDIKKSIDEREDKHTAHVHGSFFLTPVGLAESRIESPEYLRTRTPLS